MDSDAKRSRIHEEITSSPLGITTPTVFELLPREITLDVLSRLPVTSLVKFGFVCRHWRTLVQDPLLPPMHFSGAAAEDFPYLILHSDYPIKNQLSFLDFSDSSDDVGGGVGKNSYTVRKLSPPFWASMPEFDVAGTCDGLLCFANSLYKDAAAFLYNPFTGKHVQLPKSANYPDQEEFYGFGFDPVAGRYKVVKVAYYHRLGGGGGGGGGSRRFSCSQSEVQVLTVGAPAWRVLGKPPFRLDRGPSEALVNGNLHWVTRPARHAPRVIAAFDLAAEQFRDVPMPHCGGLSNCNYRLLAIRGRLSAAACRGSRKLEIWVMKEYGRSESWTKEFNIGAHVPKGLKQDHRSRSCKVLGSGLKGRGVRVVCQLKTGEILLEYRGRALFSYNPESRRFKDITLKGSPNWFQAFVLVGSLNWII